MLLLSNELAKKTKTNTFSAQDTWVMMLAYIKSGIACDCHLGLGTIRVSLV